MGYYHIRISEKASNLHKIIIPWVKHRFKLLPMGIANYTVIFQQKMNDLFHGFEFIPAYIDDLLTLTKVDWTDNVHKL